MPLLPLLLAALQLSPVDRVGYWTCQRRYAAPNGTVWVQRALDPDGTLVHEDLIWKGQKDRLPTSMTWRLDRQGARVPIEFEAFITWSRIPRRPVNLIITADGQVDRRPLVSNDLLSDFRRNGAVPVQIWYSVEFPSDGAVPSLHGVRQLTLTAVEEGGAGVGSAPLALPDWNWLEARVAEARRGLDDDVRDPGSHCRLAEPPHDQPDLGGGE